MTETDATTGVPVVRVRVDKDPKDPNADVPHAERSGECLRFAAEYHHENGGLLVHGSIFHPVYSEQRIGHAFVVTQDGGLFEPTLGLFFPYWELYFQWADAQADRIYTVEEAAINMLRHGHYGTWEDDESIWSGVWGEGVSVVLPLP